VICKVYIRVEKVFLHKDTKHGTQLEEVVRVIGVHQKPVVTAFGIEEVLICILPLLVLRSRECLVSTFGETLDHLQHHFLFSSLKGQEKVN
jgi:hypothetical protein